MCQAWAATHVFVSCRQAWSDKHGQTSMGRQAWSDKHGQASMGSQAWAAKHGQTSMGQLEQLGAEERSVLHQPKGGLEIHSVRGELAHSSPVYLLPKFLCPPVSC
ncbi:hypothetical protein L3X38_025385 [Prunus dulcis]|uniref:Uncharacterized protein n=1 Tax=Prunus dulcis TaxID=3755 RepID=A0AAD4W499_PRUDU|nr:hypothetical protein L3X38_025385 [Prunus dulcis]